MEKTFFKGKTCKVVLDSGFALYGTVDDVDEDGFFFTTRTETSYINWNHITTIVPREI
jgi:hypothetical protein